MADTYDYIVIGAGSAGCVLAHHLSADPALRVLVIEAGGWDRHPWFHMPLGFRNAARLRRYSWRYDSEPEPHLDNRRIGLPRGKVIGGTGSINAMAYVRGNPRDYDQWRQLGLEGWGYDDVLPYFRRAERNWRGANRFHGDAGALVVNRSESPHDLWELMRDSAVAAGHPELDDYNGEVNLGLGRAELTVAGGKRSSTARGYLHPSLDRPNLKVETEALTSRVIVERGRARAVEFRQHGRLHVARAEREIILSGGTYNSPQILMLSGIGAADELAEHGIAPVHHLPGVGKNLSEHPLARIEYAINRPITFSNQIRFDRAAVSMLRWLLFKSGPFTTVGTSGRIFAKTRPELERPDFMFTFSPVHWGVEPWFPLVTRAPLHRVTSGVQILHEDSRGWVKLRSADPEDRVRIQLNFFAETSDMDTMIRAIRIARELYRHEPLKGMIVGETEPGADVTSDEGLARFVRRNCVTAAHPVGTCAMGIDDRAVVDAELKVRGLAGLRVVDASVMPLVPGGNTNAPTVMIAEKAADMILGRAPLPRAEAA